MPTLLMGGRSPFFAVAAALSLGLATAWFTIQPPMGPTPAAAQVVTVSMRDFFFDPNPITVPLGATVLWTNPSSFPHTSTSDTGLWDSGTINPGGQYQRTFDTPGTFPYHCIFHGGPGVGMAGTVIVTGPPTPTPTLIPATPSAYMPIVEKNRPAPQ